jgi:hypothetical protein
MLWLVKVLLLALKTKRGRELLLAGGVGALDIARSKRARALYARAWEVAADPRPRQKAAGLVRNAAGRVKREAGARVEPGRTTSAPARDRSFGQLPSQTMCTASAAADPPPASTYMNCVPLV